MRSVDIWNSFCKKYMVVLNLCRSVYLVHQIYNRRRKIKTICCISENNQLRNKNENKYIFVFSVYLRIFSFTYIDFLLSRHLIVIFLFVGLCSYLFYHSLWSTEEYKISNRSEWVSDYCSTLTQQFSSHIMGRTS